MAANHRLEVQGKGEAKSCNRNDVLVVADGGSEEDCYNRTIWTADGHVLMID